MAGADETSFRAARCPRCGYDLRGAVATWDEAGACPLEGTCTECGYVFLWRDVLRPTFGEPAWCVEYARPVSVPVACFVTLGRNLWPRSFWRRMELHHEIRPRRLAAYVLFLIGVLYAIFAVAHGRAALYHFDHTAGVLLIQPVPGWTPPPGPVPPATPKWRVFIHAMCLPLSESSLGTTGGWFARILDAPMDVFVVRFSTRASEPAGVALWFRGGVRLSTRASGPTAVLFISIGFAILITAVTPITFLCLPTTLRRAKVRWAHVWRIGVYGAIAPVIVIGWFVMPVEDCARLLPGLMLAVLPALLLVWWGLAVRHYLRLPHAWGVAAASVAIALLATVVVFYYAVPSFTQVIVGLY